jgi:pentatricopeptide repeat protein
VIGCYLATVLAMKADGHDLDQSLLLLILHVYCHNGMWGEALQLLDDVSAGKVQLRGSLLGTLPPTATSGSSSGQGGLQASPASSNHAADRGKHHRGRSHHQGSAAAVSSQGSQQDALWHIVMRKLWERRAADSLLNEFLSRMSTDQAQRFKLLYGLTPLPDGTGFTFQPSEDWQFAAAQQQQQQQEQQQQEALVEQQQQQQHQHQR